MKKLHGIITAMPTPFNDHDSVAPDAVKRHVDFLIKGGVQCLYPLGTTGEMHLMTVDERKKVAQTVVEHADKRVTVYIHTGALSLSDTITLTRHSYDIGADGAGVVSPAFFKLSEKEMEEFYVEVAKSVPDDFPLYAYNIPQLSANDLSPATLQKIVKRAPNIIGIKYSYPDISRTMEYIGINGGNFCVLQGCDTMAAAFMLIGCAGTVSGNSSVLPELFSAIYQAILRGDWAEAQRRQDIANQGVQVMRYGKSMAYYKKGLEVRGVEFGHMRRPLRDLDLEESQAFAEQFRDFLFSQNL